MHLNLGNYPANILIVQIWERQGNCHSQQQKPAKQNKAKQLQKHIKPHT